MPCAACQATGGSSRLKAGTSYTGLGLRTKGDKADAGADLDGEVRPGGLARASLSTPIGPDCPVPASVDSGAAESLR